MVTGFHPCASNALVTLSACSIKIPLKIPHVPDFVSWVIGMARLMMTSAKMLQTIPLTPSMIKGLSCSALPC